MPPVPRPGIRTHAIGGREFRALAAGLGDGAAMAQLAEAQRSLVRGLLGAVYQEGITAGGLSGGQGRAARAWSLLTTLDRERPRRWPRLSVIPTFAPGRCAASGS